MAWLMCVWQQQTVAADSSQTKKGASLKPQVATAILDFLEGQLLVDCIAAQVFGKASFAVQDTVCLLEHVCNIWGSFPARSRQLIE